MIQWLCTGDLLLQNVWKGVKLELGVSSKWEAYFLKKNLTRDHPHTEDTGNLSKSSNKEEGSAWWLLDS